MTKVSRARDALTANISQTDELSNTGSISRAQRIVGLFTAWLVLILAVRGIANILSAGYDTGFTRILNVVTDPFVAVFKGMMSYDQSIFQSYTAVAIVVFVVIGWTAVQVLGLFKQNHSAAWRRRRA